MNIIKLHWFFRVYAVADGSDSEAPVLVVVRHEKGVLSWQVSCLNANDLNIIYKKMDEKHV